MPISGVLILTTNSQIDSRGEFVKTFAQEREPLIPGFTVAESFFSRTVRGAARGMHLQIGTGASNRIISCMYGKIFDVLVDLREDSDSYLQIDSLIMEPGEVSSIYVPAGVAHGFIALEEAITNYMSDTAHDPSLDTGVNIKSLNIELPMTKLLLSERDQKLPTLQEWAENQE